MSFNFFSDDDDNGDDDDDFDLDAFDDTGLLALASRAKAETSPAAAAASALPQAAAAAATVATTAQDGADENNDNPFDDDNSDDGGDWDNIDWEDADQEEEEEAAEEDDALRNFPTRGVMINFGKTQGKSNTPDEGEDEKQNSDGKEEEEGSKPSSKKKRKVTRVLRNVPHETREVVMNARRSHMLCCVVRCMQCSYICGCRHAAAETEEEQMLLPIVAHSLIPQEFLQTSDTTTTSASSNKLLDKKSTATIPTKNQLQQFTRWFFQFVNQAGRRRRSALQRNVAQGAASTRRRRSARRTSPTKQNAKQQSPRAKRFKSDKDLPIMHAQTSTTNNNQQSTTSSSSSAANILKILRHLSPHYDEDPQLFQEVEGMDAIDAVEQISAREKVLLFLLMVRTLGWRARYVTSLSPVSLELTVDHPLLAYTSNFKSKSLSAAPLDAKPPAKSTEADDDNKLQKLLYLMHERGMCKHGDTAGSGGRKRKRKKQKSDTKAGVKNNAAMDTIELLSSGDEDATNGKKDNYAKASSANPTRQVKGDIVSPQSTAQDVDNSLLSWVEVICRTNGGGKQRMSPSKPVARWVPIHPEQQSFDMPEEVESILAWREMHGNSNTNKQRADDNKSKGRWGNKKGNWAMSQNRRNANKYARKSPVSYVLAVEHLPLKAGVQSPNGTGNNRTQGVRFTDVTPRYANTWSRTLRLRGATGKEITAGGGRCVDEWWGNSLTEINKYCKPKPQKDKSPAKTKSPVRSVTKTKTKSGKDVDMVELESSGDDNKNIGIHSDESDSDEHETIEAKELAGGLEKEKIPTSKKGFKSSPFYAITSVLNSQDVLHPEARKRICGVFKGELVYRRSDVSKAVRAQKWLYKGRKVREGELDRPAKKVKARKKPVVKGFQALTSYGVSEEAQEDMISSMHKKRKGEEENGMWNLYGIWQTDQWSPSYVGPSDTIPTNEYRNVELALINPGLTHMPQPRLSSIAKKLGIPYAPCMLGYEGHGGNRAPTIRGIVVHDHNVALLREAYVEWESHAAEKERMDHRNEVVKRWKRLVVGMLTKDRLDRDYG